MYHLRCFQLLTHSVNFFSTSFLTAFCPFKDTKYNAIPYQLRLSVRTRFFIFFPFTHYSFQSASLMLWTRAVLRGRSHCSIALTGRCFTRNSSSEPFQEVIGSRSSPFGLNEATFTGNSYFLSRLGHARRCTEARFNKLPPRRRIAPGDLLVEFVRGPLCVPEGRVHQRLVDVSGVSTSYFNAEEHSRHAKATLSEVVDTMHWHDGSSIPEVERGSVAIGGLRISAAYADLPECSREQSFKALRDNPLKIYEVRNGSSFLLGRRNVSFQSHAEYLSCVQILAERCYEASQKSVLCPDVELMDCDSSVKSVAKQKISVCGLFLRLKVAQ